MNAQEALGRKPWVLVTGASRGIGEAFAVRFAKEGWNVALVARGREPLESLARTIEDRYSAQTKSIVCDLSKKEGPKQVYDEINRDGIVLEGLVNNAGCGASGEFLHVDLQRYEAMVNLNVYALLELTHRFLPVIVKSGRGLIFNVSSTASFQPLPGASVYSATKAFVTILTEAIWLETRGTGVRVMNLCPGWTKTDFARTSGGRDLKTMPMAETTEQVVESAFKAIGRNRPTVISGFHNQVIALTVRWMPRPFLYWLVMWVKKMKNNKAVSG